MPDLLGATNPVPGYDKGQVPRSTVIQPGNPNIQNVTDPNRVGRPDGKTEQQDSGSMANSDRIRYDSNFHTFLQRLKEAPDLAVTLAKLFAARDGLVVRSGMSEGIAQELSQALEMLRMDEGQMLQFMADQLKAGTRFGGALFALLRGAYDRAASDSVRTDILQFIKSYGDFSATEHLEGNLLRDMAWMADSIPASWAERLRQMMAQLQNSMAAGDRQGSLLLFQREVFPYMSSYVERTHDMGTARALLSLMALDVARYENGSEENLLRAFHQISSYGTLKGVLGGIDDESLLKLLRSSQQAGANSAAKFADHLAEAAARALRGEGSAEVQETFRQLVSAMLINESVYMPINHYLFPLEMDGRMLFSELWVDPDEEEEAKHGGQRGGMRMLFKIDVQSLGLFDVVLVTRDRDVEMLVACPERVAPFAKEIEQAVTGILVSNGLKPTGITVRKMDRPVTLTEVFPKIFEGRNSIDVKA